MTAAPAPPSRACPRCSQPTRRVARRLRDRVLSWLMPVKRYRCCTTACGWEGLLLSRPRRQAAPRARRR